MTQANSRRLKTPAMVLGMGALVAMGAIGVLAGGAHDGETAVVSGSMMTGETTTLTFTGTVAPVKAVPPVKAKPYSG